MIMMMMVMVMKRTEIVCWCSFERKCFELKWSLIFVTEPATIETVEKTTVAEGGYLTLSCQVSGDPFPSVSWVKVMGGKRFNGSNLSLRNVNMDASGEYRCEATNLCSSVSRVTVVGEQCKYDIDPVSWSIVLTINFGSVSMTTRRKKTTTTTTFEGIFVQNCT